MSRITTSSNHLGINNNIGTITTTGTSNTAFGINTGNNNTISSSTTINILGEKVELSYRLDISIVIIISTLNVLGVKYYDEIIKNGITFHGELKGHMDRIIHNIKRDNKLSELLD